MAQTPNPLRDPWLVAVWPGMGSVAWLAGGYLLQQLDVRQVHELDACGCFDLQSVEVKNGLVSAAKPPHCLFFEWRDPAEQHDLLVFVGESQPESHGEELCRKLLEYAAQRGVKRFITFAAMATQLTPGKTPRVFAAATSTPALAQVRNLHVDVMQSGEITGLNGLLLGVGAERGMSGICLLGEMPYFAVSVPNPRASLAVLQRFIKLTKVPLDLTDLEEEAQAMDRQLEQLLEQMQQAGSGEDDEEESEFSTAQQQQPEEPKKQPQAPPQLDSRTQQRVEQLFQRAREDRAKAVDLKRELDRLGVFKQYEDRFLDLFRQAE